MSRPINPKENHISFQVRKYHLLPHLYLQSKWIIFSPILSSNFYAFSENLLELLHKTVRRNSLQLLLFLSIFFFLSLSLARDLTIFLVINIEVHWCRIGEEEAGSHGNKVCDSARGRRRDRGGPGVLSRPWWLHDRDLQLRQFACSSSLFVRVQAQAFQLQGRKMRINGGWNVNGDSYDGELERWYDELFILILLLKPWNIDEGWKYVLY